MSQDEREEFVEFCKTPSPAAFREAKRFAAATSPPHGGGEVGAVGLLA